MLFILIPALSTWVSFLFNVIIKVMNTIIVKKRVKENNTKINIIYLYEDKTPEKAVPEFAKISNSLISFLLGIFEDSKNNFSTLILKAFASGKFVKSNVADAIKTINKKARMLNATLLLKRSFSRLFKTLFPF